MFSILSVWSKHVCCSIENLIFLFYYFQQNVNASSIIHYCRKGKQMWYIKSKDQFYLNLKINQYKMQLIFITHTPTCLSTLLFISYNYQTNKIELRNYFYFWSYKNKNYICTHCTDIYCQMNFCMIFLCIIWKRTNLPWNSYDG